VTVREEAVSGVSVPSLARREVATAEVVSVPLRVSAAVGPEPPSWKVKVPIC
jgi:hypothetical protein